MAQPLSEYLKKGCPFPVGKFFDRHNRQSLEKKSVCVHIAKWKHLFCSCSLIQFQGFFQLSIDKGPHHGLTDAHSDTLVFSCPVASLKNVTGGAVLEGNIDS